MNEFIIRPLKQGTIKKRKGSSSNHYFSGDIRQQANHPLIEANNPWGQKLRRGRQKKRGSWYDGLLFLFGFLF